MNEHAATVASVPDDTSGLAYDLGDYRRQIVTSSPEAQRWFDIGLRWAYCFNFEEAVRCFEIATQHDPECVMAYWGMVYASGPNYNSSWQLMDAEQARRVIREVHSVFETVDHLAHKTSKCELDLINAIRERFPRPTDNLETVNFASLNMAYAEAMRTVYERHGDQDIDVATLYVDALMCVSPRALWNVETGEVIGYGAIEARQILENVMKTPQGLKNPALPHLYVHLMEMSPFPELAQPSADRLRGMAPDASHTVHMATHIDHACGDWRRVIDSNRQAADVDDRYFADTDAARSPMYHGYRAHNLHTMAYGAMMLGRSADAMEAVERLEAALPEEVLRISVPNMADWAESYIALRPHVLIRFGRWEEILELDIPEDRELYSCTVATILYAKGIALAALGRTDDAASAQQEFRIAKQKVPASRLASLPVRHVQALEVADAMLNAELEYRLENYATAWSEFRRAIALEDSLPYADPPALIQPVRHAYGALLLEQGHVAEAAEVYRADLGLAPDVLPRRRARVNNMWSLHGLYECLTRLDRVEEAKAIELQKAIAVANADIEVGSSCFCRLQAVTACCAMPQL